MTEAQVMFLTDILAKHNVMPSDAGGFAPTITYISVRYKMDIDELLFKMNKQNEWYAIVADCAIKVAKEVNVSPVLN